MDTELINPYIAGAPVTETRMFFGREDVFDWIQNSLVGKYADHILVIHGQRRVGKTSVLKQLGNRLPKRYVPVFFDLQGRTHTTLDRFLWWLAREIARVLKQDRGLEIPIPDKDLFAADPEYFENRFLPDVLPKLDGGTLLLTFDEFDNLEEKEIKETLSRPLVDNLRRLMGREGLNFIFSIGSSGRKLENMQADYTEFFKSALYKKISFLTEEQTHNLITRPVEGILAYDRQAVNRIYKISGGHPYFTQLTCHELFAGCQRTGETHIKEKDVESVLEDVVERGTVNLKFVWDEASDLEKWALASLATLEKTDNGAVADRLKKERVRFSDSDLTSSLLHLREKDVLTPENRFVIHLLKLWLQKNRPIEQVREELTEVNPIANRYIEIGLEFKNSRQYEKAIESFQQALAVSPGNVQAQVSTALVYMDQKAYDKAVGEFEKALSVDDEDVAARSGLCEAHLALGDAAMQKGRLKEAGQSYQRVLAINEEHTEARGRMAEINRQRAEKALTEGRDEEALNAFADALKLTPEDESLTARVEQVRAQKKEKIIAAQIARSQKEAGAKNWEAAIRTLEEAKSLAPDDPNILKRLEEIREKLRESKLSALRSKAQGAESAERFGEAVKAWQGYLELEPKDRTKAEEEIARLGKSQELEKTYNEAQQAITGKNYDKAISLLKQVIVQDENFKDTSRLLTQAIELRRSTRPARLALPVGKLLKGLLVTLAIAGLGIGAYFVWNQWGANVAGLFSGGSKVEKVCFLMTGMDDARSYWNSEISQAMTDVANAYQLESKSFLTRMAKEEYEAQLTKMIQTEKCDLILGSGIWLKDTFYKFAKAYPNVKFSLIDVDYGTIPRPLPKNLIEQVFAAYDSGYMAGYLAAGLTKTGKVGTFGAEEDNQYVYEYMKGFIKGVEEYNRRHDTQVQALGYNLEDGSGLFAGGYGGDDVNREVHSIRADNLIKTDNVDVLFIASSPDASEYALETVFQSIQNNGTEIKVIGTDVDWAAYYAPAQSPWAGLCITSAVKNFESMVKSIISRAVEDPDNGETIEGNGSNQGVGLSPFNESLFGVPNDVKTDFAEFQLATFGLQESPESASSFTESILAYIAITPPDFEEDFSTPKEYWTSTVQGGVTDTIANRVSNGVFNFSDDSDGISDEGFPAEAMKGQNFALEFDYTVNSEDEYSHLIVHIRYNESQDYAFKFNPQWWQLGTNGGNPGPASNQTYNFRILVLGNDSALYINNELLMHDDAAPSFQSTFTGIGLHAEAGYEGNIDNIKFWNLENFSSSFAGVQPTTTADPRKLNPANQHQYLYIELESSWYDARDYCSAQGGYLVTIQDATENEFVYQLANGKTWLGATDEAEEGTWAWVSGEPWDFQNWENGEPNNQGEIGSENFLSFSSSTFWNDMSEGTNLFVCEWEPSPTLDPAIQTALETIESEAPLYQTSFDAWESWGSHGTTKVENGKLLVTSENQQHAGVGLYNLISDKYAVQFDRRVLEAGPEGHCIFETTNDADSNTSAWRAMSAGFSADGSAWLAHYVHPDQYLDLASSNSTFDFSKTNTVTLVFLGDQIAAFMDGNLAFTAIDPDGSTVYNYQALSANFTAQCEYDNFKIWDLSGVDLTSSTAAPPTATAAASPNASSLPSWVTDFAEPILAAVQTRDPDFHDDFNTNAGGWKLGGWCADWRLKFVDGEMIVSDCSVEREMWFTDFIIEMDYRFLPGSSTDPNNEWRFHYRRPGVNYYFDFEYNRAVEVGFERQDGAADPIWFDNVLKPAPNVNHLLIIVKDQEVALFVNDQPLYYGVLEPIWKTGGMEWSGGDTVAYDNFKIWDLNNIPNLP